MAERAETIYAGIAASADKTQPHGPDGPAAAKLLSLTLLFHVPPLTVLLRALLQHRQIHMFAPTEWSERSGVPAALTAAADLFCLARCVAAT